MAFTTNGLVCVADSAINGGSSFPNLWVYQSTDATTVACNTTGYFSGVGAGSPHGLGVFGLKVGDVVIVKSTSAVALAMAVSSTANGSTSVNSTWGYDISLSTWPITTL